MYPTQPNPTRFPSDDLVHQSFIPENLSSLPFDPHPGARVSQHLKEEAFLYLRRSSVFYRHRGKTGLKFPENTGIESPIRED